MMKFCHRFRISKDAVAVLIMLGISIFVMTQTFSLRDRWPGVPPAPTEPAALFYGAGDRQLSYRQVGMMLQNAGDNGGRMTSMRDYDYGIIKDWLWLSDKLDPKANYVPSLAAFYFGSAPKPEQLKELVEYLVHMGTTPGIGERWRWLAHAIYLTRFKIGDKEKALEYAKQLSAIDDPDMPEWARAMPAYVMADIGDKKAARDLMLAMAFSNKRMAKEDINQTCWYVESKLREPDDGLDTNDAYQFLCGEMIKDVQEDSRKKKAD